MPRGVPQSAVLAPRVELAAHGLPRVREPLAVLAQLDRVAATEQRVQVVRDRRVRIGGAPAQRHLLAVGLFELDFLTDGALDEPGDLVLAADRLVVDDPAGRGGEAARRLELDGGHLGQLRVVHQLDAGDLSRRGPEGGVGGAAFPHLFPAETAHDSRHRSGPDEAGAGGDE